MNQKSITLSMESIMLCIIVSLSYLYHFFEAAFSTRAYLIAVVLAVVLFIVTKKIDFGRANSITTLWIFFIGIVLIGYVRSGKNTGVLLDIIVLLASSLLVFFSSKRISAYQACMKVILFFALLYAFGMLAQKFVPSVFNLILRFFPSSLAMAIRLSTIDSGFAPNPAFTAGYVSTGILAVMASVQSFKKIKLSNVLLLGFLLLALFFTGKRGHALFAVLTVMLCYLLPSRGTQKMKRYWVIFMVALGVILAFYMFRSVFVRIPIVQEIIRTIEGLLSGEDVTSTRSALYEWAWTLFKRNPILGIGWGNFRNTVVGNATVVTVLDTHNIYLQLLCETGLVGFIGAIVPMAASWLSTKNLFVRCMTDPVASKSPWCRILFFSFAYQTFFLLYGLTGNPLYDTQTAMCYFFSCSIAVAARFMKKTIFVSAEKTQEPVPAASESTKKEPKATPVNEPEIKAPETKGNTI